MRKHQKITKQIRTASPAIREILAENIIFYRRKTGLSQERLADLCDLHRTYIGSIERCERNATLSTLEVIADALGLGVPELLTKSIESDLK